MAQINHKVKEVSDTLFSMGHKLNDKFDSNDAEVSKDTAKVTKHSKLVEPMKVLGFSVLWEYFRTNNILSSDVNLNYVELIDWGASDLSGLKITVNFSRYLSLSCIPS